MSFPIVALIGPSGSGKTTLILKLIERFPNRFVALRSFTTRPWREPQDNIFYECISQKEFERRRNAGLLLHHIEYAGHAYGNVRAEVDEMRQTRIPILALIEASVKNFERSGYPLIRIGVIPAGALYAPRNAHRQIADAARAKEKIVIDGTVVNSFEPGGFDRALESIIRLIEVLMPPGTP